MWYPMRPPQCWARLSCSSLEFGWLDMENPSRSRLSCTYFL